jgi:hypothetical protein
MALVSAFLICVPLPAHAVFSIDFGDFNSPAPGALRRNGNAALTGGVLRLTADAQHERGSSFLSFPFDFGADVSFSTRFQFQVHGILAGTGSGGDGLVFVVQSDPRGTAALGGDGSGLGYGNVGMGGPAISRSVAIAFDTYPFQQAHQSNIELLENGEISVPAAQSLQNLDFAAGTALNAWIDYSGAQDFLKVYLSQSQSKPLTPAFTAAVSIEALVGPHAFIGFSAATGDAWNIHDVDNWQLTYNSSPVPECSSIAALTIMSALWVLLARARKGLRLVAHIAL